MAIKGGGGILAPWFNKQSILSYSCFQIKQTCVIESHIAKGVVKVMKTIPLTHVEIITL